MEFIDPCPIVPVDLGPGDGWAVLPRGVGEKLTLSDVRVESLLWFGSFIATCCAGRDKKGISNGSFWKRKSLGHPHELYWFELSVQE